MTCPPTCSLVEVQIQTGLFDQSCITVPSKVNWNCNGSFSTSDAAVVQVIEVPATCGLSLSAVRLLTHPPPGKPRLIGADASHAWISVFTGDAGWIDFDPTNNVSPGDEHITLAWGRDYSDVCPIEGVYVGGGSSILTVEVDVQPLSGMDGDRVSV